LLLALGLCIRRAASLRERVELCSLVWVGLGLGIVASIGWVIAIGGDFMSGRFFAPALFLAALLVAHELREAPRAAAGVAAVAVAASLAGLALRPADPDATWHGIADERRPRCSAARESATARRSAIPGRRTERVPGSWRANAANASFSCGGRSACSASPPGPT
jgi:hypothetical protein